MKEKMLPQNIEAEESVLGCILLNPRCLDEIDFLRKEDFYREKHRLIFEAIKRLQQRRRSPDLITVCEELEAMGKSEDVPAWDVSHLASSVPSSYNVASYAEIVQKMAVLRRQIDVASRIAALAYERAENAVEEAERLVMSLKQQSAQDSFSDMPEMVSEYMEELNYLQEHRGSITGVPTGYKDIDSVLGGLQKSDFILLAGRPSMGKTSLAMCIGYNAACLGKKVAVFSLEMGRRLLIRRLVSMHSKVDMQRLRFGWVEDNEWDDVIDTASTLSGLPIWVNDTAGNPISSMRSQLRKLMHKVGNIDLVIVDYLGLINPEEGGSKNSNLVQQVTEISKGMKNMAREFDLPMLVLAQLSRAVESRQNKRPMLSDLRDSGSLEQDADVVLFVYREDYYAIQEQKEDYTPNNIAEVLIAKHRNGPTGQVALYFKPDQTMFHDLETGPTN